MSTDYVVRMYTSRVPQIASIHVVLIVALVADHAAASEPLFENVTKSVGLERVDASRVAFVDINGDGRPDAIIGVTRVYLNQRGRRFERSRYDLPWNINEQRRPVVVQFGDVNNDGHTDVYFGRSTDLSNEKFSDDGLRSEIWLGDGEGRFHKVDNAGVGKYAETTVAACFVDYDRDGKLDLFVGNAYVAYGKGLEAFPDRLYHGNGDGTFEDVTDSAGLLGVVEPGGPDSRRPTYGVTHSDWNSDGRQDLLVMTYGRQWNRLWRNNGDGTFTDVAYEATFDGDAIRDGKYSDDVKNMFKKRSGTSRADEPRFRANGNTFDCAVADFDNDGDMDCFLAEITHWWGGPSSDLSMLLINGGPRNDYRFRRAAELINRPHAGKKWNQGDLHAGWLDVDNDGWLDLLIASSDYPDEQILRLYRQIPPAHGDQPKSSAGDQTKPSARDSSHPPGDGDGDGNDSPTRSTANTEPRFEDWTERLGFKWINASQLSLGDFDRDGATDILLGTNNMRLTKRQRAVHDLSVGLFRNLAAARAGNGFISIRLRGQAIGARVTIHVGDHKQTREIHGGLGHAGHRDDDESRFGVGKAERVERVEVTWPDFAGTTHVFENVAANTFYVLSKNGTLIRADSK